MARPRGTDTAKVVQVIETTALRGEGTEEDMCRIVTQYWSFNGKLLAEHDPARDEFMVIRESLELPVDAFESDSEEKEVV